MIIIRYGSTAGGSGAYVATCANFCVSRFTSVTLPIRRLSVAVPSQRSGLPALLVRHGLREGGGERPLSSSCCSSPAATGRASQGLRPVRCGRPGMPSGRVRGGRCGGASFTLLHHRGERRAGQLQDWARPGPQRRHSHSNRHGTSSDPLLLLSNTFKHAFKHTYSCVLICQTIPAMNQSPGFLTRRLIAVINILKYLVRQPVPSCLSGPDKRPLPNFQSLISDSY